MTYSANTHVSDAFTGAVNHRNMISTDKNNWVYKCEERTFSGVIRVKKTWQAVSPR